MHHVYYDVDSHSSYIHGFQNYYHHFYIHNHAGCVDDNDKHRSYNYYLYDDYNHSFDQHNNLNHEGYGSGPGRCV